MGTTFFFYSEAMFKKNCLFVYFIFGCPGSLRSLGFPRVAASGVWSSSLVTAFLVEEQGSRAPAQQ